MEKSYLPSAFHQSKFFHTYPLIGIFITLFFTFMSAISWGNERAMDLTELSIEDLMKVTIETVSKFEQRVIEAPASVSIITKEEIKKYGYRTLADMLRGVQGLFVNYDRAYHYLGMRGFARGGDYNTRFLLLINGHRINETIYDTATIGNDFPLDIDLIDRVEIIRGPGSSLYGTNAIFGIINIITRKGRDFKGFEASGEAGSFSTYKGRLSYGNQFEKGPEVLLSGSLYDSQGNRTLYYKEYNSPATNFGNARNCDGEGYGNLFGKVSFHDFTLEGAYNKRKKEVPTGSWGTVFNSQGNSNIDERAYLDLKHERQLAHALNFKGRIYYDHYYYHGDYVYDFADPGNPPLLGTAKDHVYSEVVGGEFQLSKTLFEKHKVILGSEYRYAYRQDQKYSEFIPIFNDQRSGWNWAGYFQDEFEILRNLKLNAGVRYDYYSTFGGTINPRLAIVYFPFEKTALKLIYGQAFRAPNVYELYYTDNSTMKPNPDLDPETIQNLEFVFQQYLGFNLWGKATVYYQRIKDLISQQIDPADGSLVFQNVNKVDGKGLELELEGKWENGLRGRLSYALQKAEDRETGEILTNSPKHLIKLNGIVPIWKEKIFLGLEEQFTSGRKTFTGGEAKSFFTTNLTLFSENLIKGLEISASVYNLFNKKYSDPVGEEHLQDKIEQDGRTFRFKMTYRF
jgi:outer membrane receptor for ferrienterochelin and colicins